MQGVDGQHSQHVEDQHGHGIAAPVHFGGGVHPRQAVESALQWLAPGGEPGALAVYGLADVAPEQRRGAQQDRQVQQQQTEEIGVHQNFSGLNSA
ncbi:Uncharacterised protein [Bordetella pertussis]|nr:Uncharacterised protein [Bordetella pertussis]CFW34617.1 Uncharacterised protein [Bordetella pertussis]